MTYLKYLRIERGLTQLDVALSIGVRESVVSRIENGWMVLLPSGTEEKLAELFGPEWTFKKLIGEVKVK